MKIKITSIFFVVLLLVYETAQTKEVTKKDAETAAINAYVELLTNKKVSDIQITETLFIKSGDNVDFYIVNLDPAGFVIVSADDATIPILGKSLGYAFSLNNIPPQLNYLFGEYKKQIRQVKKEKITASSEIKVRWNKLLENTSTSVSGANLVVGPLLSTTWNQNNGWNRFCPVDSNGPGGHAYAGCVAVAMAQILKCWGCKVNESGNISYTHSNYGNLSANLTEADYPWSSMGLSSSDDYNAKLIYDCGVSVSTDYGPNQSGAYSDDARSAFVSFFGFNGNADFEPANSHTSSEWISLIKTEIDAGRPVYYEGSDYASPITGAHAWVIDGYNDSDCFHCNWGWDPVYNGYYALTSLTPAIDYDYSSDQSAILNLEPIMSTCEEINGSSFVCSLGSSFYVNNLPTGASVVWCASSNITIMSQQPSNPCTFQPNGSGSGWIEATISLNGSATLDRKNVWVGDVDYSLHISRPDGHPVTTDEYGNPSACPYTDYEFYLTDDGMGCYTHDHVWTVPSTWTINYQNQHFISINTNDDEYNTITVEAKSCCGDDIEQSVFFEYSSTCDLYSLMVSPNPATNEAFVELKRIDNKDIVEYVEWDIEVYDQMQSLKEKVKKYKEKKYKLNTSGWREGVYIINAIVRNEILTAKLVVTK